MRIIDRDEWGADPASLPSKRMTLPAKELWIHHTVTEPTKDPAADIRIIEQIGLKRFGHISYSYVVHPEGQILEGAGLRRGAHTARRNSTSFGVAWIGNYQNRAPKIQQMEATRWLIWWLQEEGHLRPEVYPTGGHRDVSATACPGNNLYRILDDLRQPWFPAEPEKGEWPVLNHPPKVIVTRPQGDGYWIIAYDGGVFAFGNAPALTGIGGDPVERIVSASAWPDGEGLLCLGEDGGVFALGSAEFKGRVEYRG